VHFHVLPRKLKDDHFKRNDDVYPELEAHGQKLQKILEDRETEVRASGSIGETLKMDVRNRKPRSIGEMVQEAEWLRSFAEGASG
jgi:bis(5'-adenosyl)-triphosphatase